ncbi:MAG: hypothetical protein AAGI67_00760 [Pseudomonadota bacterium]
MKKIKVLSAATLCLFAASALADLTPWTDYEPSQEVYMMTTIRVDSNMEDAYLEGLKKTWVPGQEAAKEIGQIKDYSIYRSQLSEAGDFNLVLVVALNSADDMQPTKERYDALMKKMGETFAEESTEYAQKNYPAMRTITGNYMMRKIEMK